ncbi:MAG: sce7726 family protein [Lachnospiraceae bacterium]|nr:sce7726 family protein [Lachnospiraceae bacterium]
MLYDRDIREPLFDFLEERYEKSRIIEEKQMGRSRADIMMVLPEALVGIEIKSDADTYARLERQVKDYDRFFDYNYVVAGSTHGLHIGEHVPDWWGIITVEEAEGQTDFYMLRQPGRNPKTDWRRKLSILWRPELAQLQEWNSLPKYREKSKDFVIDKLLQRVSKEELAWQVSEVLFERDYTEIGQVIREYRASKRKNIRKKRKTLSLK